MTGVEAGAPVGDGRERIRVLHVDDDPAFVEMTAEFLESADDRLTVLTETDPGDALDRLVAESVDCVVSDYEMPGMDGIEFLRTVRERRPELPFILFTGKGTEAVASDAFSAGATDYFQKERGADQYEVLANRIATVVERATAQRQRRRQVAAIESAREGISILNADGRFVYVNEAYAELYGYAPEEMVGEHWELIYPDDEVAFAREEVLPTVDAEGYWHGRTTGLRADGSTFPEDHVVSATDGDALVCTVRDLSRQEAWEQEIDRYRTLVETLDDPVYVLDETGAFEYVNDAFVEMVGYDRERILGADPSLVKGEPAVERAERQLGRILSSDGPDSVRFEIRIQPKDGDSIPCEDHMGALPYEGASFRGSAGILRDVSDRKEREQELLRHRRVIETVSDPVYALDADGRFTYVNDALVERSGYERDRLLGSHASLVMTDEHVERGETLIATLLADDDRSTGTFEMDLVTAAGTHVETEAHVGLLRSEAAAFDGTTGVLRDVSERKQQARELERQNERLDEFASVASHDLRNPLNLAQGRLELAREECDSDHLDTVATAHDRMETLIDDLLTFAREGTQVEEFEPVDLGSLVRECWDAAATGEATLKVETDQVVDGDSSRLQQLLENLIRNAVEHGGDDVTVTVGDIDPIGTATRADARGFHGFYVADDGPGIPAEERDRVFEAGHSTREGGVGLGLAIVRNIVEAHGWEIAVTEGEAGGARFEITPR